MHASSPALRWYCRSPRGGVPVDVAIPSLSKQGRLLADTDGRATGRFRAKGLKLWAPGGAPVLAYDVGCRIAGRHCYRAYRFPYSRSTEQNLSQRQTGVYAFVAYLSMRGCLSAEDVSVQTMQDAVRLVGEAEALGVNMIRTGTVSSERAYRAPCRRARYPALGGRFRYGKASVLPTVRHWPKAQRMMTER